MIIKNFIIVLIVSLCCISCITDISVGKVKNLFLIIVGMPAIALNCIYLFIEVAYDVKLLLISVIIPLIAATLLYIFKIWAGGDYKLFFIIILAMPYDIICSQYNGIMVGILLIGISFSIGYLYIIIESIRIYHKQKDTDRNILKKSLKDFAQYIPLYFFISILQKFIIVVSEMIGTSINGNVIMLIVIVGVLLIRKFELFDGNIIVSCVISILYIILALIGIVPLFDMNLILLWILILVTYLVRNFVNQFNYQRLDYNELKPGMILSFETSCFLANSAECKYNKISNEDLKSRLSKEEINEIMCFYNNQKSDSKLTVIKKVPFALFISVATVILIIRFVYYVN